MKINNNWIDELVDFYDFIWQEGLQLCGKHINEEIMNDFRNGGKFFEKAKKDIMDKFPKEEDARVVFKKRKLIK